MRKYRRPAGAQTQRRVSGKVVLISATVGVLAAGTGISLAATQGGNNGPVTCIAVADATAAADANSALSDVFAVGTPLHLASGGRTVDVTVSGPITKAAATSAAATTAPAPPAASDSATPAASDSATPATSDSAPPAASDSATPSASDSTAAGASATPTAGTSTKPAKKKRRHRGASAGASATASATPTDPVAAANLAKVSIKASNNDGVDPNTVCVKLSTNAFNTLGNVGNGNNVGAFIATITPGQAGQGNAGQGNAGQGNAGQGNGGAAASASASATPSAAATSAAAGTNTGQKKKKHH